jgi:hypothetical protein
MDDLEFKENSKTMFEEVCNATPWLFRHFTRNGLIKGLREEGCGQVTEQVMYKVCQKVTPEKHLPQTIEILEKHKTTSW